jgi:hypothetical protein
MAKTKSTSALYFRRGIRRAALTLVKCIEQDYPDTVIELAVIQLLHHAAGLSGGELWRKFGEKLAEVARQHSGFCQHCDATCDPGRTHPFTCTACDKETEAMADEIDDELGDEA